MADEADYANQTMDFMIHNQINNIRNQKRELEPTQYCHWCEEDLDSFSLKLFCSPDCSHDYERAKRH